MTRKYSGQKTLTFAFGVQDVGTLNTFSVPLNSGTAAFPDFARTLGDGTGANNYNKLYYALRTVGAGLNDDVDLTALTDRFGGALSFGLLKWFFLRLVTPATGIKLVVGSAGANAFVGWFGAATHTEEVRDGVDRTNQIDGWLVDATHRLLRINNPGAAGVDYHLLLAGE